MNTRPLVFLGVAVLLALTGCATTKAEKKPVYSPSQTGVIIKEQRGEILGVRDVIIAPPSTSIYGGAGQRVGSIVGEGVVEGVLTGTPTRAAARLGGIVGGEIGAKTDAKAGEEITIRTDNDSVIVIVQERGEFPLAVGERVRILTAGSNPGVPVGSIGAILRGTGSAGGSTRVERENNFAGNVTYRGGVASARESRQFNQ